jgi:hypothetical protein
MKSTSEIKATIGVLKYLTLGVIFFHHAADAQILGGLRNIESTLKSIQNQPSNKPAQNNSITPIDKKSSENKDISSSAEKSCDTIKNNKTLTDYSGYLSQIETIDQSYSPELEFDADHLLKKWVSYKFAQLTNNGRDKSSIYAARKWVNKCAFELMNTQYLWLFTGIRYQARDYNTRDSLQKALETYKKWSQPKVEKVLDANGNFSERTTKPDLDLEKSPIFPEFSNNGYDASLAAVYAIYLDGENAINSVGAVLNPSLQNEVNELKKIALAKKKAEEEANIRISKISKGDLKAASNCLEIAIALDAENGLQAYANPNNKLRNAAGKLNKYTDSKNNGVASALISSDDMTAEIRTSNNTIWFGKDDIKINSFITAVGKYAANTAIQYSNGAKIQAPVIDAICIQPNNFGALNEALQKSAR